MQLTENLVYRVREWRDRSADPDLVARMRRLWARPAPAERAPGTAPRRRLLALRAAIGRP